MTVPPLDFSFFFLSLFLRYDLTLVYLKTKRLTDYNVKLVDGTSTFIKLHVSLYFSIARRWFPQNHKSRYPVWTGTEKIPMGEISLIFRRRSSMSIFGYFCGEYMGFKTFILSNLGSFVLRR